MALRPWAAAGVGCLVLAACSGERSTPEPAAPGAPVDLAKAELVLDDMRYSPATLTVAAGQPLMLTISNEDEVPHEFIIRSDAKTIHLFVNPDKTIVSSLSIAEPGSYRFVCEVADHEEQGMVGTLEVT